MRHRAESMHHDLMDTIEGSLFQLLASDKLEALSLRVVCTGPLSFLWPFVVNMVFLNPTVSHNSVQFSRQS
jgi:hypothetical protein